MAVIYQTKVTNYVSKVDIGNNAGRVIERHVLQQNLRHFAIEYFGIDYNTHKQLHKSPHT